MRTILITFNLILLTFLSANLFAQNKPESNTDPKFSLRFDTRFDYQYTTYGKNDNTDITPKDESGFVGRYLKLVIDGKINDKFSYSFRHRLYVDPANPREFFSATDWANITYSPSSKFSITAGKQIITVGTFEYDFAPIDVYYASNFWNNVNPYQIGVKVGFMPNNKHSIFAQVTNSPFSNKGFQNLYAYNLIWYGNFSNWFKTIYSANLMEYSQGDYINYIALGNRFSFGKFTLDVDYINRYAGKNTAFFNDFTILGRISYDINNYFKLFTKGGYDQNLTQEPGEEFIFDRVVVPGIKQGYYGAGIEFFPLTTATNKIRLHAFWYSTTENPIPQTFNVGIKWNITAFER